MKVALSAVRLGRTFAVLAVAVGLTVGAALPAAAATRAVVSASTVGVSASAEPGIVGPTAGVPTRVSVGASCGGGRCTVYFSRAETAALSRGAVPAPPAFVPAPLKVAYYAFAHAHRWFAGQYAARGWCSGFRLSIYPWESQGYFGYAC
jgi:Uncharacterized protein conserved in bacteria with the myosin-like domain